LYSIFGSNMAAISIIMNDPEKISGYPGAEAAIDTAYNNLIAKQQAATTPPVTTAQQEAISVANAPVNQQIVDTVNTAVVQAAVQAQQQGLSDAEQQASMLTAGNQAYIDANETIDAENVANALALANAKLAADAQNDAAMKAAADAQDAAYLKAEKDARDAFDAQIAAALAAQNNNTNSSTTSTPDNTITVIDPLSGNTTITPLGGGGALDFGGDDLTPDNTNPVNPIVNPVIQPNVVLPSGLKLLGYVYPYTFLAITLGVGAFGFFIAQKYKQEMMSTLALIAAGLMGGSAIGMKVKPPVKIPDSTTIATVVTTTSTT
jgi:hypothetical protein